MPKKPCRLSLAVVAILATIVAKPAAAFSKNKKLTCKRPDLVRHALDNEQDLYYFGLGSNMSRKKLENRGLNSTKIDVLSFEAAVVPNYRLAFNMRGFPPIEPGMGSLEPSGSKARALLKYKYEECHGALIKLTAENYKKVMASEGVSDDNVNPGYEEIIVDAYPYGRANGPVKAVALRARPHARLNFDPSPSARYMGILRDGARELNLKPCYQEFLERHPVQETTKWQRKYVVYNLVLNRLLGGKLLRMQSALLFLFYVPSNAPTQARLCSELMIALILLPGFLMGYVFCVVAGLMGRTPPFVPMLMKFLRVADE